MCNSCQETNGTCIPGSQQHLHVFSGSGTVRQRQREAMSFTKNPTLAPDKDSLPLKKRDQSSKLQQQCDAANFKAPYPYKSHGEFRAKHTGPFRPVPRRVTGLYQPWVQTHAPARPRQHIPSAFREHHGWAEWRDFSAPPPDWDFPHYFPGHQGRPSGSCALHPGHPYYASRFSPASPVAEGLHKGSGGWEKPETSCDTSVDPESQGCAKHRGSCVRRGDRKNETLSRVGKSTPSFLSTCLPHPPHEDVTLQRDSLHKPTKAVPVSGDSLIRVSPDGLDGWRTCVTEDTSRPPAATTSDHASSSSSSANRLPWLLPHFMAGSLIELRDGRLRRVEHLQTEDFLLGSQACPDLRLSCCTVQSISSSASSSSVSRLLILLHDQQSQELVDVYVEYPFFVRGRGWSSCSPQRTARLCGLQCRQLAAGDVCLALTPGSAPDPRPSGPPGTPAAPTTPEEAEDLKVLTFPGNPAPLELKQFAGGQKMGAEAVRRRHRSAP